MGGVERVGKLFFKKRGILGVPFFLVAILFAKFRLILFILGSLFVFFGELFRILSLRYSGPTTRARELVAPELVKEGTYSIIRNPLYFGNFFIGFGFSLLSGAFFPYLQFLFIPLFFLEYFPIVIAEEKFLEEKFGDEYKDYMAKVPRFLPKLKGVNWGKPKYRLGETLRWERSTFYLIISLYLLFILSFILRRIG